MTETGWQEWFHQKYPTGFPEEPEAVTDDEDLKT
jgi:hypothetical protein